MTPAFNSCAPSDSGSTILSSSRTQLRFAFQPSHRQVRGAFAILCAVTYCEALDSQPQYEVRFFRLHCTRCSLHLHLNEYVEIFCQCADGPAVCTPVSSNVAPHNELVRTKEIMLKAQTEPPPGENLSKQYPKKFKSCCKIILEYFCAFAENQVNESEIVANEACQTVSTVFHAMTS